MASFRPDFRLIICSLLVVGAVAWWIIASIQTTTSPQPPTDQAAASTPDVEQLRQPPRPAADVQLDTLFAQELELGLAAVGRDPSNAVQWANLGLLYHANDRYGLAEACYEQSILRSDTRPHTWYYRALAAQERDDLDAAVAYMTRSLELEPYAPCCWRIGQWLQGVGRTTDAIEWYTRASELDPASDAAWIGLARCHLDLRDAASAIAIISSHLLHGPNDRYARHLLSTAHRINGDLDDARHEAGLARDSTARFDDPRFRHLKRFERGYEIEIDRSNQLIAAGRVFEAASRLREIQTHYPSDTVLRNQLGLALMRTGQTDAAITELAAAREADPTSYRILINLALAETQRGTARGREEAIGYIDEALRVAPNSADVHDTHGFILLQRGDLESALDAYQRAAAAAPTRTDLLRSVADLQERQSDFEGAIETLERIVKRLPDDLDATVTLATLLTIVGEMDQADHWLTHAATYRSPNTPAIRDARRRWLRHRAHKPTPTWTPHADEWLDVAETLFAGHNRYLGRGALEDLERAAADPNAQLQRRVATMATLALEQLRQADVAGAVGTMSQLDRLAAENPQVLRNAPDLLRLRGLVFLRQAELTNCVQLHNADCCIFPLRGGGVHDQQAPTRNARAAFERYLERVPDNLGTRWLLNIVAMAMGDHPDGVSDALRIEPQLFESDYDIGRFRDIAPDLGVNTLNLCGGCIVDDFDGDGHLDIVTSTYDPQGSLRYYRSTGDGSFEDRSTDSRIDDQFGGLNIVCADYDNDGDPDVLVLRGAWLFDDGQIRNSLLRNDDGIFTDVTHQAGLAVTPSPTQAAVWADFNNDGWLDLFIGNESRREMEDPRDFPAQFFVSNGDGTFREAAALAGVTNDRYCKGVTAGDYDNDGDMDLYVSNLGANRLYQNAGDGTFIDVAPSLGVDEPVGRSFATWFFDVDNDGWLDLFVAAYDAGVSDIAADTMGLPNNATPPQLYRNRGDGTFESVTEAFGLRHAYLPMGANFGDLDNDGWLDIYLATGEPDYQALMPNVMLRNDGGRVFQDVTTSGGFGHLQKGHGVAFADLDNDGDQDIYHQVGGFFPGDQYYNALFENPGHGNHWISLDLVGTAANRSGVGARIRIVVETPGGPREIHRAVGSVSSFGGSPRRQEIGLGDATSIARIEITWPGQREPQVIDAPELDSRLTVEQN